MTSRYTVVQYVPNPAAGERMNIGVIVWDPRQICARFLSDWHRVATFGGEDVQFLRDFARRIAELGAAPATAADTGRAALETMIAEWRNSIQFTKPRGSVADAPALVKQVAATFLREHPRKPEERGRQDAALHAYDSVIEVVSRHVPTAADGYVRYDELLHGKFDRHYFDVVLVNDGIAGVVNALHFDTAPIVNLEMEVDAIAWAIDDMHKLDRRIKTAVFALPPTKGEYARSYERAQKVFRGLKTPVIGSDTALRSWTEKRARGFVA